ncbi:MAG TPA: oxygenase MpaB family protein [Polyangiaceae bacterium]
MSPAGLFRDADAETVAGRVAAHARDAREGLFGPESMLWTIARENVLFAGAPRALLLQLAHPAVLTGILEHSQVASDPLGRSVRTFEAMYTLTFGDTDSALGVIRTVWKRHQLVRGEVLRDTRSPEAGAHYEATHSTLLRWVWATLEDTMVRTFETFVRPLSPDERSRFHDDGKVVQLAFGVPEHDLQTTPAAFDAYVEDMLEGPVLDVPPAARAQWELLVRQPPSGGLVGALMLPQARAISLLLDGFPSRLLAPVVARLLAAGTLPPRLRAGYGLRWSGSDAAAFKLIVEATRRSVAHLPKQLRYHAAYWRALRRLARRAA